MYKIKSDDQKAKALKRLETFEKDRKAVELKKGSEAAALFARTYQPHVDELKDAVARHDQLRQKGVPNFHGTGLEEFGHYLVDVRIASGLTQETLAGKLGVSQPMVFKYENAGYQGYGMDILQKAAEALGVQIDFGAWKPATRTVYGPEKQEAVILYFLNEIPNAFLGKTKLNKLLYYTDFEYYQHHGGSVTGDLYIAHHYGPVPEHAEELLKRLEKEDKVHVESSVLGDKTQTRYFAKVLPNLSILTNAEKDHLRDIAKRFEFWTAGQMTAQTHEEYPWRTTPFGDVIRYELASNLPIPSSAEEPS